MTTIKSAANTLLNVCDGARTVDHAGFNKFDTVFVRDVLSHNYLTYNQEAAIHKLLVKYRVQLSVFGINYDNLTFETQKQVVEKPKHISSGADKVNIPFGKYKGKTLEQIAEIDFEYIRWMAHNLDSGYIRDCAKKVLMHESIIIETPKLQLSLRNGKVRIKSPFEMKDAIKELPERKWNPDDKVWEVPLSVLRSVIEKFPESILTVEVKAEIDKAVSIAELANKSSDASIDIKFGDLQLLPFQSIGVKFIEKAGGKALIADEPGLGKTIQALAYLRLHPESRPALIVCPASLKLNWRNEANKWLDTTDKVSVINGGIEVDKSVYIINYDILIKYESRLKDMNFQVIILDESHMVKNFKSQRTKVSMNLSKNIPNRLLLSGTPILNRPNELFTQLNIINSEMYPKFSTFAFRYCAPQNTGYGWDFSGTSNINELNDRLKTIMVRRTKEQVLKELPAKRRQTIIVPLSNKTEYMKAHNDFIKYLRETYGNTIASKACDAEQLVRIEGLKQLSVKGKMYEINNFIDNFLESGQKLVVFAWHTEVIKQLLERYHDVSVSLTGDTKIEDRQKAVDNFMNNDKIKLFIGNIKSAGLGITLTSSSNVAFVEFPWTPSDLLQAEDRVHRIGQVQSVNIYYLAGENSIDLDIIELLEKKASIIDGIIDGKETTELNIFGDLIKKYI